MFNAQQRMSELDLKPYEFVDMEGVVQQLPNLGLMTLEEVDEVLKEIDLDPVEALKNLAEGAAREALLALPAALVLELSQDWMKHSNLGESQASSPTTANTTRPLKPILPASSGRRPRRRR
jgi:hypothetical protein